MPKRDISESSANQYHSWKSSISVDPCECLILESPSTAKWQKIVNSSIITCWQWDMQRHLLRWLFILSDLSLCQPRSWKLQLHKCPIRNRIDQPEALHGKRRVFTSHPKSQMNRQNLHWFRLLQMTLPRCRNGHNPPQQPMSCAHSTSSCTKTRRCLRTWWRRAWWRRGWKFLVNLWSHVQQRRFSARR